MVCHKKEITEAAEAAEVAALAAVIVEILAVVVNAEMKDSVAKIVILAVDRIAEAADLAAKIVIAETTIPSVTTTIAVILLEITSAAAILLSEILKDHLHLATEDHLAIEIEDQEIATENLSVIAIANLLATEDHQTVVLLDRKDLGKNWIVRQS